ncbi:MAG TPA: Uma2 family endonuclease [Anaerolineae bacterium]|nr:Uma2 family endonuclease [Anaerolineae bacterium]
MTLNVAIPAPPKQKRRHLPPLQSGDYLSRHEFERRYESMPDVKAELIEGVVYMASPVHLPHSEFHSIAETWLGIYILSTPGLRIADNVSLRLGKDSEVQPDICAWIDKPARTPAKSEEEYLESTPEFIVEIAASSASFDLRDKMQLYRRHSVREYLVLTVYEQETHWFMLDANRLYRPLLPDAKGIFHSAIFPGLRFEAGSFWQRNWAELRKILQAGMATPEYAAFAAQLQRD